MHPISAGRQSTPGRGGELHTRHSKNRWFHDDLKLTLNWNPRARDDGYYTSDIRLRRGGYNYKCLTWSPLISCHRWRFWNILAEPEPATGNNYSRSEIYPVFPAKFIHVDVIFDLAGKSSDSNKVRLCPVKLSLLLVFYNLFFSFSRKVKMIRITGRKIR